MKRAAPPRSLRHRSIELSRGVAVMVMTLCALSAGAQVAGAAADRRLDVPPSATARAEQSVMLAVAPAGHRLVVAGERGLIIHSDDCGASWQQARVPVGVTLTALHFVDDRQGWAVGHGGVVLVTHDAGATWQKQLDGRTIAQLALAAAKAHAAAGGSAETQRALRDAERLVVDGPDKPLFAVHFWSPLRGMVVGAYGLALVTEDGGAHWQWMADRIPNPKGLHLYGLWAHDNRVYVAGEQGLVAHSDDGGQRFQSVASPYTGSYFGIAGTSRENAAELVLYGLRGHAFQLSAQTNVLQPLDVGVPASVLTVLPRADGGALLFDADGQVVELRSGQKSARPIGSSPVGPVLGAAAACGSKVVVAGLRGVALIDAASMTAAGAKGISK